MSAAPGVSDIEASGAASGEFWKICIIKPHDDEKEAAVTVVQ